MQSATAQPSLSEFLDPLLLSELRRIELRSKRALDSHLLGNYRSAFRGSGLLFSDLREYQPGDEVKNIHWKATARTGKVYVKSYEEDRQLQIILAVDTSASTRYGAPKTRNRRALEFAALVAALAIQSRDSLGLCLFSDSVEEFLQPRQSRTRLTETLFALLKPRDLRGGTNIGRALEYINKHQRRSSVIFVVSDFFSDSFEDELRSLAYRHDVICAALSDSIDGELPDVGLVEYCDAETGQRLIIDASNRRTREMFRAVREKRLHDLRTLCAACRAECVELIDHPLRPLAELMRQRTAKYR